MAQKLAERVMDEMTWLDPLADTMQGAINEAVKAGGPSAQAAKDALNGRWLGHPLHPALVAVPLGAWTATLVLDLIGQEDGADVALALGIAGAVGSALAGLADWNDTYGTDRRTGLAHALLNSTALGLNIASLALRRQGARTPGVALSTLSFAIAGMAGYLGGELAYVRGIGVDHTAWDETPAEFTPVIDVAALEEGQPARGEANGLAVVVVKQGSDIFALDATCPHAGGPLNEGTVEGDTITCPWHGSTFCLSDGSTRRGPATMAAKHFETRVRDGKVEVRRAE